MRPEDIVNWLEHQDYRCILYPGRDCPGCIIKCARMGTELGEITVEISEQVSNGTRQA